MDIGINNNNAGIVIFLSVFFILNYSIYSKTIDSIPFIKPNEYHGLINNDTSNTISKKSIQRINYSTMYDILNTRNELFGMSLGINGHYNNFLSYGALDNNIEFSFNGRNLTNYYNSKYNIENFSPEFFERIELINGSDAAILSSKPNNTLMNFQEIIYDTKIPFTRLWYAQEGGSFISADGIFSQNFSDGWNFTFGFKKMDDRLSFDNMSTDYWNLRFILRFNIDSTSSLSISDNFTNNKTITSGGSDPNSSIDIYSPINSSPFYESIQLRNYRHDLNITYSNKMSFFNITNTTYLTSDLNERNLPMFEESDTLGNTNNTEIQIGNRINLDFSFKDIEFKVGSNISSFSSEGTNYFNEYSGVNWNLYSKATLRLSTNTILSGGINYGNDSKKDFIGFGERLEYRLNNNSIIYLDHSFISKNGLIYNNDLLNEKTNLLVTGIDLQHFKIEGYYRIVSSPIYYRLINVYYTEQYNISDYQAIGGSVSYTNQIFNNLFDNNDLVDVRLQTKINIITKNDDLKNYYPIFAFNLGLNYMLMINKSELNIGFKAGLLDSKSAPRFIPISNSYINNTNNVGLLTTGLNLYSIMKLGNAFVKVEWENLLDANYYNVAFYPERGQIVKLSVAWSFFD